MHSPLVVLGGGPGGYAAAFLAADEGLDVTIVEADPRLGGTCLLRGCIPSKALLHVARVISEVEELREDWGVAYSGDPVIDVDKVRARKEKVITTLTGGLGGARKASRRKSDPCQGRFREQHDSSPRGRRQVDTRWRQTHFRPLHSRHWKRSVRPSGVRHR